jgi:serine/threonine-protein kinase
MYPEATEAALKANTLFGGENSSARARIGWIYALSGQRHKALEILDELKELSKGEYVAPSGIALVHVGLGENEEALQWLEKGYEKRDGNMILLKVSPIWDPLRDDPRFQELLRRMNFPE